MASIAPIRMGPTRDFFLAGKYTDSCWLGQQVLLPNDSSATDAFIARFDPQTQNMVWVWSRAASTNHALQKLRFHEHVFAPPFATTLIGSGTANDSMGWLLTLNATNGQLLSEKVFPGILGLSDAIFDPRFPGSFLITGIASDSGYINQVPITVPQPATGFCTFLARYFPQNDSVVFLHTLPYLRHALQPVLVDNDHETGWSSPRSADQGISFTQLNYRNVAVNPTPSSPIAHDGFFHFIEGIGLSYYLGKSGYVYPIERLGNEVLFEMTYEGLWPGIARLRTEIDSAPFAILSDWHSGDELLLAFPNTGYVEAWSMSLYDEFILPHFTTGKRKWGILAYYRNIVDAVTNHKNMAFRLYPNPVIGSSFKVQLDVGLALEAPWLLRDLYGRVVRQGLLRDQASEIHCEQLPKGMYFFELQLAGGVQVQKSSSSNLTTTLAPLRRPEVGLRLAALSSLRKKSTSAFACPKESLFLGNHCPA